MKKSAINSPKIIEQNNEIKINNVINYSFSNEEFIITE
jgi:hypothetical protein